MNEWSDEDNDQIWNRNRNEWIDQPDVDCGFINIGLQLSIK